MFRWLYNYLSVWRQMFQPSEERVSFEAELKSRPTSADAEWDLVYEEFGRERTRTLIAMIEEAAQWPPNKLLPTDSLDLLFHGKANEDMPFGRFSSEVRREYGVCLLNTDIRGLLNTNHPTLQELLALIVSRQQASAGGVQNGDEIGEPPKARRKVSQKEP